MRPCRHGPAQGHPVKQRLGVALAFVFLLSILSTAQTAQPGGVRQKKVSFSGKISEDGTAIVAAGTAWLVSNIESLQNHKGQNVTVKGLLDPVTHRIEVLSMKLRDSEANAFARLGDSAFRR